MNEKEIVVKHIREENKETSSLEISTPAKGGAIKVYGNPEDVEGFKKRIDNMLLLREHASKKIEEQKNA